MHAALLAHIEQAPQTRHYLHSHGFIQEVNQADIEAGTVRQDYQTMEGLSTAQFVQQVSTHRHHLPSHGPLQEVSQADIEPGTVRQQNQTSEDTSTAEFVQQPQDLVPAKQQAGVTRSIALSSTRCRAGCRCKCHKLLECQSPTVGEWWTGRFQLKMSNMSWFRPACGVRKCVRNASSPSVALQYKLPAWLASRMIWARYTSAPLQGPELLFKVPIVRYSDLFYYANKGNVKAIQTMFSEGLASPNDVHPDHGGNALLVCISHLLHNSNLSPYLSSVH